MLVRQADPQPWFGTMKATNAAEGRAFAADLSRNF